MTREEKCLLGCLFAVNRIIEKGGSTYAVKVNGKWETIEWTEITEWIEKQYAIESGEKMEVEK